MGANATVERYSAYVIQQKKYSETSLIVDLFTEELGIVSVLAKGALRKKSPFFGILMPFVHLSVNFSGRSQLKNLVSAELLSRTGLTGMAVYCGFYINELISLFIHPYDANIDVFELYQNTIMSLSKSCNIEPELRYFEMDLLVHSGFGLNLDIHTEQGNHGHSRYTYNISDGLVKDDGGYISGATLQKLVDKDLLSRNELSETKMMMRHVFDTLLQGREIKSRKVIASMNKYLH